MTAMCPSFLNDSYFHVVTNFSGMDIKTSLKTRTIGSIAVPVVGSIIICIASFLSTDTSSSARFGGGQPPPGRW